MAHATKEKTDEEWRAWTREHLVCYEVQPLQAVQDGNVVQIGFEFEIAAYVPIAGQPVATRRQAATELQTGLTQLARRCFRPRAKSRASKLLPSGRSCNCVPRPRTGPRYVARSASTTNKITCRPSRRVIVSGLRHSNSVCNRSVSGQAPGSHVVLRQESRLVTGCCRRCFATRLLF